MLNYLINNHNNYFLLKIFHIFENDNAFINRFILSCFFLIKTFFFSDLFNRERFNILKKRLTCFKAIRLFDFNKIEIKRNKFNILK